MRYIIIIATWLLLTLTVNATEYLTVDLDGKYIVLNDSFSTAEEEKYVDEYVENWSKRNKYNDDMSMYYRIRNHIARITTYDNDGKQSYTPYGLIHNRRAVCMGYALLAKKMFDAKGISNELVYDTKANHLYNRATINNESIDIDITWFDVGLEKLLYLKGVINNDTM